MIAYGYACCYCLNTLYSVFEVILEDFYNHFISKQF